MKKAKTTKKFAAPPTVEEIRESGLKSQREKFIPEPPAHRICKVGDRVKYGVHPNTEVQEVFEGGKYLQVKIWGEYKRYHDMVYEEKVAIINWLEVVPEKDQTNLSSLVENIDIRLDYANYSIDSMIYTYLDGGIDMNPSYQRDYVWTDEDKVELIDSIFCNRSIGTHVLVWMPFGCKYHYEVLDGKQRIDALISFFTDRFKYKGKYFSELSYRDQGHFENFMFSRAEIKESREQEVPLEKKIKIFLHVNSCGRVMDKAHLEKVKAMLV